MKGLSGERLGGEDTKFGEKAQDNVNGIARSEQKASEGDGVTTNGEAGTIEKEDGGTTTAGEKSNVDLNWQELSDFEREQDIVQGEIGPRDNAQGKEAKHVPKIKTGGVKDKEARKAAKKERRKAEKRDRAEGKRKKHSKE